MRRIAETLVPLLLVGDDVRLEVLRRQWQLAEKRLSDASDCGFYLDIAVPADAPRLDVPDQCGGDAVIPVAGDDLPAGCVLYVVEGALSYLEVYSATSWDVEPVFGAPTQIQPLRVRPR